MTTSRQFSKTYLVFAAGESSRWTGEVSKHLVDTYGEPLIARTARQLRGLGISPMFIINDEAIADAVEPCSTYMMPSQSPNLSQNVLDVRFMWEGRDVCILLGDVMWAFESLVRALDFDEFAFGASHEIFAVQWKHDREEEIASALTFSSHCAMTNIGLGKMWNTYRALLNMPMEEHVVTTDYLWIGETFTRDFDFYDRYVSFLQLVRNGLVDPTVP